MQGLGFTASVSLNPLVDYGISSNLTVARSTATVDPNTAQAIIDLVSLSGSNAYILDIKIDSPQDPSYGFTAVSSPIVVYPVRMLACQIF